MFIIKQVIQKSYSNGLIQWLYIQGGQKKNYDVISRLLKKLELRFRSFVEKKL